MEYRMSHGSKRQAGTSRAIAVMFDEAIAGSACHCGGGMLQICRICDHNESNCSYAVFAHEENAWFVNDFSDWHTCC